MAKGAKVKRKYTLFTGKQLLWLILPIVIEQIFSTSLGMFDSIMISHIPADGSNASLAVGNVDYINNLIIQLFSAFATGGAIITSQYLGAQDNANANKSAKQMLVLVILISLGIGGLCLALNWPILRLFYPDVATKSPVAFNYQQIYFYVTAASFPFIGLFNACAALLRVQRKSFFTMVSAAISCVLNVGLNAVFLFVVKMGVLGAGLATLICRAIPAIFMLVLLGKKNNTVCVRIFEKFRFDGQMLKKILKIAVPSGVESCLFQLGKLMTNTFVNAGCYVNPVLDAAGNYTYDANGDLITINLQANGNTIANQINNIASVVGGGVGVLRCGKQVIPRLQDIGFGVHIVVGDKVLAVDGDGDGLGLARLNLAGLFKAHQGDGGLFHIVGLVVVGIGGVQIDLHHLAADHVAGVLHIHLDLDVAVRVRRAHLEVGP